MSGWRQAQRDREMLDRFRNTVREEWYALGCPRQTEDYWSDDPAGYPPGWRLAWIVDGEDALCDLIVRLDDAGRPPRWRFWRVTSRWASWTYVLGLSAGVSYGIDRWGAYLYRVIPVWRRGYDGKRRLPPYILGWPTGKWRCLLRFGHWPYWPDGRPVAFGMCGRCVPWPCCGSIETGHAEGCRDA